MGFDADQFNVGIDASVVLVSLVLALYPHFTRRRQRATTRMFAALCLTNAVMALADLLSWVFPLPLVGWRVPLVLAGNFVFNGAVAFLFLFFARYVRAFVAERVEERAEEGGSSPAGGACASGREAGRGRFPVLGAMYVVAAVYFAGCVVSLGNHMFFGVAADTRFYRGELFWLAQVFVVALYAYNLVVIVLNRRELRFSEVWVLASYVLVPALAEVVQLANFGLALVNLGVLVSLVAMLMFIQTQRDVEMARRERALAAEWLALITNRIRPDDLYERLDEVRALCASDPEGAADLIGEFSAWLRERMRLLRG